jgi:DinB superfamily
LLFAADAVPRELWKSRPGDNRWSAGELVGHLMTVETRIISRADHRLEQPPKRRPFFERFHVPMVVVEARLFRRTSPIPVARETIREKEEMLSELREVRERTLAFIGETTGRNLDQYCMPHPFLGTLTAYEWCHFIASHEIRHAKQMAEIAAALPKNITKLQK